MNKLLGAYQERGDFGASLSISVCRREDDDEMLRIEMENPAAGISLSLEITKHKFRQLIGEVELRLSQ